MTEGAVWKRNSKWKVDGDRVHEQLEGFSNYTGLKNMNFGNMIEVGSGPWTQTRGLL